MDIKLPLVALSLSFACLFGCTKETEKSPANSSRVVSPHSVGADSKKPDGPQGFVGIVINQKLDPSNSKTIGAVFEEYRYFKSREWKETRNTAGKVYVDFKGMFSNTPIAKSLKDGVSRQGVEVKFVVEPNGNFYVGMISRIDVKTDGMMSLYPLEDGDKIIKMIYDNKEISF